MKMYPAFALAAAVALTVTACEKKEAAVETKAGSPKAKCHTANMTAQRPRTP